MQVFCGFFLGILAWVAALLPDFPIACQNLNEPALDMLRICLNLIFHFREIQGEISWLCTDEQSW